MRLFGRWNPTNPGLGEKEREYIAETWRSSRKPRHEEAALAARIAKTLESEEEAQGEENLEPSHPQQDPQSQEAPPWRSGLSVLTGRKIPITTKNN